MELSNIITIIVSFAIVVLPIWYFAQASSKQRKKRATKVAKLKAEYQLDLTESDHWDNLILGIDEKAGKLLWFKEGGESDEHKLVDLRKIGQFKKVTLDRDTNINQERRKVIDQLGLELHWKASNEAPLFLEFYNSGNSFLFSTQLELQEKWHKLINTQLADK